MLGVLFCKKIIFQYFCMTISQNFLVLGFFFRIFIIFFFLEKEVETNRNSEVEIISFCALPYNLI